jgi:hypothetical protein
MLPVERSQILWAKWLGGVLRLRFCGLALVAIWFGGLLLGALHPLAVLLLASTCAAQLAFVATIALCLSVYCKSTLHSNMLMGVVLLLFYSVGHLALNSFSLLPADDWLAHIGGVTLNPIGTWSFLSFSREEFRQWTAKNGPAFTSRLACAVGGLLTWLVLAGLLWLFTARHFRREEAG